MLMIATQLYFRLGARPYGRLYLLGQQHQDSIVPCDAPFDSSNTDELQIRYQRPYGRLTIKIQKCNLRFAALQRLQTLQTLQTPQDNKGISMIKSNIFIRYFKYELNLIVENNLF